MLFGPKIDQTHSRQLICIEHFRVYKSAHKCLTFMACFSPHHRPLIVGCQEWSLSFHCGQDYHLFRWINRFRGHPAVSFRPGLATHLFWGQAEVSSTHFICSVKPWWQNIQHRSKTTVAWEPNLGSCLLLEHLCTYALRIVCGFFHSNPTAEWLWKRMYRPAKPEIFTTWPFIKKSLPWSSIYKSRWISPRKKVIREVTS